MIKTTLVRAQSPNVDPHQYTTRFEQRNRLTYQPQVEKVTKTFSKDSWNPFRKTIGLQQKTVSVVKFEPRWSHEVTPVTQRVARTLDVSNSQSVNTMRDVDKANDIDSPRVAERSLSLPIQRPWTNSNLRQTTPRATQSGEEMTIGRAATQRIPARPSDALPTTLKRDPSAFGGVQRLTEDVPRTGIQWRATR